MYEIQLIYHEEYFKYLSSKQIPNKNKNFRFLHSEHFVEVTSSFITDYVIELEINKLIKNNIISSVDKESYHSLIDYQYKKEIYYFSANLLKDFTSQANFSIENFLSFFTTDIQKYIENTFYEHLLYSGEHNDEVNLGLEKADVIYMIVEANGSITLEKKDCTIIANYSYYQQEQSVAEVVYLNPFQLIVYDPLHLLQPEMTICLKKLLKGKVVFLEQEHPLRKNRTKQI